MSIEKMIETHESIVSVLALLKIALKDTKNPIEKLETTIAINELKKADRGLQIALAKELKEEGKSVEEIADLLKK